MGTPDFGDLPHWGPLLQCIRWMTVKDEQLIKKEDDWVIEETNFCLGRMSFPRFRETDDLARRTQMLIDSQISAMHTRLRDGTCIPVMDLYGDGVIDRPSPVHINVEQALIKYVWDETYA